jgi:glycosyltransferase involved in cell wall biosynthesis
MGLQKLAVICTHPIQYYSPWFRYLQTTAEKRKKGEKGDRRWEIGDRGPSFAPNLASSGGASEGFDFEVFYAHKQTPKGQAEAGFGVEFEWDVPVLEGYPYRFLKNVSQRPGLDWFGGCDCPEIGEILVRKGFTHVLLIGWHKKVFWQAFWAAKKAGIKVLSRGDSQLGMTTSPLKQAVKFLLYRFLLPRFDAHLFVGRRNREYLKHYGVKDARLFFSPHFIDNEWWSSRAAAADSIKIKMKIKESDVPGGESLVMGSEKAESENRKAEKNVEFLFAGKFIPKKRVMDLLEAAAKVPEARVVLVGDGPLRSQLEERAERPDLKGRVEFVGFKNQQELPAYLAGADCLALPSDGTETWGLIVNEAMACGTPAIVSTACGCEPDLIVEGETGYSFPLGDTHALADRLRLFIQNKDRDWGANVRKKVAEYSMVQATDGLMKAIRSN